MTPLSERRGSRAVLIGVAEYTHPEVSNLTAVATNLTDLAQVLTAADGGGFEPKHCVTVTNPDRRRHVGEAISRAGREATDVLLVYYAGHGMLDRRGRLHLALTDSDPDDITWSSVQFDMLREAIVDSGARVRILILDCCFSGRAFEAMSSTSSLVAGQVEISGTYVITSSGANETSFAPAGDRNTAFTAALLTAAAAGPGLTLEEVYRRTDQLLMRNGHPRPKRRSVDVAGEVRLFGSRTDEVELRRAAGTGHVDSMGSLARMLLERGELAEAETWYRRASKAGSTLAMHN
ncbi:caspase domain-containing protein, partial [Nocardia neocaledoniensis]